ncbi:ribonucrease Y [Peptoniphilus asaccharolyticus DSM 20463]|uniref:Ribonuclease Y n=1 Tax=Peptoniphilus asaccharolyticus DSM 20463 TaxID=573058 RepID=A0A1W1US06_PEPAS|nr:ribonuclease Y [Peptoniphilus asaccharolyticus]MBL7575088.1 ribonuclease Y [Peptoniphilus asaccharolyticus]SMB83611.1 ribonucrease Y [Peptoniphilus asaccharolyticus DSM 20463]
MLQNIIFIIISLIFGCAIGYGIRKYIAEGKTKTAEELAVKIVTEAEHNAEAKKRELLLEAKDEIHKLRSNNEYEYKTRRNELQKLETRILNREEAVEKRAQSLEKKEDKLNSRLEDAKIKVEKAEELVLKREEELQKVAGLTAEEGKSILLNQLEREITQESALIIKENELRIKEESNKYAQNVIAQAIQRIAADQVAEATVSVVQLPNDEMKGRIIGREGRNIRSIESLTGVDLIIDDTPEAVVLSCFDPVRREIARIALEKLVQDGRIHPTKIEESVEKAKNEVDIMIKESGEQAAYDAGVHGLHPEIIKYLGRLKFRTSYGQNMLKHAVEVANIAGILAQEIGADVKLAKRGGLLHDIGKSIDHDVEAPHVDLGIEIARKYNEPDVVINCIQAHHGDVEFKYVEAVLATAADAISAARPGARRETVESYIKRLEKLEEIATSFEGIEKSYAIQAGREVRIIVKPEIVSEAEVTLLARKIVKEIEAQLDFPGQIKVNVIRETKAIEYAK